MDNQLRRMQQKTMLLVGNVQSFEKGVKYAKRNFKKTKNSEAVQNRLCRSVPFRSPSVRHCIYAVVVDQRMFFTLSEHLVTLPVYFENCSCAK